jgi:ribosomal protein S18 acetylase RimI-like enzyme
MPAGGPVFIDVPYPVSEKAREIFRANALYPTGESRSSMMLTEHNDFSRSVEGLRIHAVEPETLETFLELFLRGFETPDDIIPLARALFRDLIIEHCQPDRFRLYLGTFRGVPACTQYLFYEGGEGGVNMVSTKKELRGKGLATAMVRQVILDSRDLGISLLSLETRWNGAPERLYRRLGFSTIMRHEVFTNSPDLEYGL